MFHDAELKAAPLTGAAFIGRWASDKPGIDCRAESLFAVLNQGIVRYDSVMGARPPRKESDDGNEPGLDEVSARRTSPR